MKPRFSLLTLVATIAALVACAPTMAPNDKVSEGEKKTVQTMDGQKYDGEQFSLVVPKSWKLMDFSKGEFDKMIDEIGTDPKFKGMESSIKALAANKQFKLFAFAPDFSIEGFAANLNAISLPLPAGATSQQVFDANMSQLKTMVKGDVPMKKMTLGGVEAARLDWTNDAMGKSISTVSVIAVSKGNQIVVTFAIPKEKSAEAQQQVDEIINSITFK